MGRFEDKWGPEEGSIVLVSAGRTDADIVEANQRIARGEDATAVWADIDARVERRWRERLDSIDGPQPKVDAL